METEYIENPFFKKSELVCKETGRYGVQPEALNKLIQLRKIWGRPMVITSAYRHYGSSQEASHPIEWRKGKKSCQHALGTAFDIRTTSGSECYDLMKLAFEHGWKGIACGKGFLHVDARDSVPVVWSY